MIGWTDIHTHLNMLDIKPEEAIANAEKEGVKQFITIGTQPEDLDTVYELSQKYYPKVLCTLGVHPHDAKLYTQEVGEKIVSLASKPYVAAIGEIGLDYYYKHSDIEVQKEVFEKQLEIAKKVNLPIEIHTRDAEEDTIAILKKVSPKWSGVIHCFTGTDYLAQNALSLGLNISVSGIVTFKKSDELREVIRKVPLDRLHVETDSPFLAPSPMRGKKNQPAFMIHTAKFLANLKGVELKTLQHQVHLNNQKVFPKLATK